MTSLEKKKWQLSVTMFTRDTALTSDIKLLKTQNVKFIALFLEKMLQAVPTECAVYDKKNISHQNQMGEDYSR